MVLKRMDKFPKKFHLRLGRELHDLSTIIKCKRKTLNLTQEELAEALEISLDTIKAIECGRRHPSLPMLFMICFTLNIDVSFDV